MAIVLMAYDADLQSITSDDEVDPTLGIKLKVYDGVNQLATILLSNRDVEPSDGSGPLMITVYRDENVPLGIRTVDYFDPSHITNTRSEPITNGNYYTVLRDR